MIRSLEKLPFYLLPFIILSSFSLYLFTLAPTVGFMDSGELITACATLGVAHPPGAPLYVLLGKLFSFIPFGNVAYRLNLMSALFASFSVGIIFVLAYLLAQKLFSSFPGCIITAFAAASLFAFLRSFWFYALITELYTLNAFFFLGLFLILLLWREKILSTIHYQPSTKYLYLFAFVFGLSLTNHYSVILLFPAFAYFILATLYGRREVSGVRRKFFSLLTPYSLLLTVCFFLLGLSIYLYLPIRSRMNPLLDWGNPETLKTFFAHITFAQRRGMIPTPIPFKEMIHFIFIEQLFWPLYLFVPLGLWVIWKRKDKIVFFSSLLALPLYSGFLYGHIAPDRQAYFFPCFAIICFWIATGAGFLVSKLLQTRKALFKTFAFLLVFSIPISTFFTNFRWANKRNYYFAYDYGMNILNSTKPSAVIFTSSWYFFFISMYLQNIEEVAPDKTIISLESIYSPWYIEYIIRNYAWIYEVFPEQIDKYKQVVEEELEILRKRGVSPKNYTPEKTLKGCINLVNNIIGYSLSSHTKRSCYLQIRQVDMPLIKFVKVPQGLVFQVHKDKKFYPISFPELNYRGITDPKVYRDWPLREILPEYWQGWFYRGIYAEKYKKYEKAVLCYRKALQLNPAFSPAKKRLLELEGQN